MADKNEKESRRKLFFRHVRSKLTAMAMAGFLMFGWAKEGMANQIHFEKKDQAVPEMVLEPAITQEKLRDFEERLKKEEPEFIEWADKYEAKLVEEIDAMSEKILNFDSAEDQQIEAELKKLKRINAKEIFEQDHRVIEFFKDHPDKLQSYQEIVKRNLRDIILSAALLDQSPAVRKKIISAQDYSEIIIDLHHVSEFMGTLGHTDKQADIHTTPRVFLGVDDNVSNDVHMNFMVHEILHTLQKSGEGLELLSSETDQLRRVLNEGVTQNKTYEIIQYLQSKNTEFKNILGHHSYDQRIIAAVILDAISKSYGTGDSLARWSSAMINDAELAEELRVASIFLGLDPGIADELKNFNARGDSSLEEPAKRGLHPGEDLKLTINLLARLQNSGLTISPKLIKNIFTQGRTLDLEQIKKIDDLTQGWRLFIDSKTKKLKK